jgi:hypothetical protein
LMEHRFARLAADDLVDGCLVDEHVECRRLPSANLELAPLRNPGLPTRLNAWADGPMKTATSSRKSLLGMPSPAQPRRRRRRPPPPPPPALRVSAPLDLRQTSSQCSMLLNPSPGPSFVHRPTQSRDSTSSLSSSTLSLWRLRPPPPGPSAGGAPSPDRSGHRPFQGRMWICLKTIYLLVVSAHSSPLSPLESRGQGVWPWIMDETQ